MKKIVMLNLALAAAAGFSPAVLAQEAAQFTFRPYAGVEVQRHSVSYDDYNDGDIVYSTGLNVSF